MKRKYLAAFAGVREILNRHDPIGLIAIGAPENEYDPEVGTILPRLTRASSPEETGRIVREELERWFGESGRGEALGAELWALRQSWGTLDEV